jgi:hypothetical protein
VIPSDATFNGAVALCPHGGLFPLDATKTVMGLILEFIGET